MRKSVGINRQAAVTAAYCYEVAERTYLTALYFALPDAGGDAQLERNADNQAEITEALSEMWRDIAAAYAGRWEAPPKRPAHD